MVHGNKEHMSISSSSFAVITNIWGKYAIVIANIYFLKF